MSGVAHGQLWHEEHKLTAGDGAAGDRFGFSVSLDGNRIGVGARDDDGRRGGGYVFRREGGLEGDPCCDITDEFEGGYKLTANDGAAGDHFGVSVSLDSGVRHSERYYFPIRRSRSLSMFSRTVVGACLDDSSRGAAYVFRRESETWVDEHKLTASDGAAGDRFGFSVSLDSRRVVVGADGDDSSRGAAYVFRRINRLFKRPKRPKPVHDPSENSGISVSHWVEEDKLTASDGAAGDRFGFSVSLDGTWVVVGADGADSFRGSAYVFRRKGRSWVEKHKLTAGDGAAGDRFGFSVSLYGNRVVVGARGDDRSRGAAYVSRLEGDDWVQEQKLTAGDGAAGDSFGSSVSLDSRRIVVGAEGDDSFRGSAYVFR